MKVNYPERIEDTVSELKIIMSQQRTVTNRQKIQALYLLKSGLSQSITNVAEVLGVHRITVLRLFKQYSEGGLSSLLKLGQSTGRPRAISSEIIAGISTKINEESWEFKIYKEIARWVEENYQVSVKYQTLHKQIRYRMKAKLKFPRLLSNKKDPGVASEFKKKLEKFLKVACWLDSVGPNPAKKGLKYWCQDETRIGLKTIESKKSQPVELNQ